MEENNNSNPINENNNEESNSSNDFSNNLENEKNNLEAEKFAKQQEQYKQIIQQPDVAAFDENPYMWRIGFGRRLGAYIIDYVFFFLLLLISALVTGVAERMMEFFGSDISMFSNPEKIEEITLFVTKNFSPLMLAVTFIYYSLEVIFAQSLGKMLLGIQIGTADKKIASYPQLLFRFTLKFSSNIFTLLAVITSLTFFDTFASVFSFVIFVGCFFVLSAKKQALHDTISKTAVYFKDELQQLNNVDIK